MTAPLVGGELPDRSPRTRRWCFADQLGPHFLDDERQQVLLVESHAVFRRRRFHRRKVHLVLSALRHRAAELGSRATLVRAQTYTAALAEAGVGPDAPVSVCDPTTYAARRLVRALADGRSGPGPGSVEVLAERGFAAPHAEFAAWVRERGQRRLTQDDWYRRTRRRLGLLVEPDGSPVGGSWSYDGDNREPPPAGATRLADAVDVADPWWPTEDEIDDEVREDLDRLAAEGVEFVGEDGPRRFAVTRAEALAALDRFLTGRLEAFGSYEDAILSGDRWLAHSLLSVPLNLGLLDPVAVARATADRLADGARLASVEGFVRQLVGWRDYVWHLYWAQGEDYRERNALAAHEPLPDWFASLDTAGEVEAACLRDTLSAVRQEGWTHHIPRLMILGNWAMLRGYDPQATTAWFHEHFVDGYDWVMVPNVVGMALHADGGVMATKPYAAGGAYLDRMSDHCGGCRYDPRTRVGERACPFTAGYWQFVHRHRDRLRRNPRTSRAVATLDRLKDRDELLAQEAARGDAAP